MELEETELEQVGIPYLLEEVVATMEVALQCSLEVVVDQVI